MIHCCRVGAYEEALTFGRAYEVREAAPGQYRVRGDNGRVRWFPAYCFSSEPPVRLVRWAFGPGVPVRLPSMEEADLEFSDGTRRWLWVATPEALRDLLERNPPGFALSHMLLVPDYEPPTVEAALRHLERHGDLREASRPVE